METRLVAGRSSKGRQSLSECAEYVSTHWHTWHLAWLCRLPINGCVLEVIHPMPPSQWPAIGAQWWDRAEGPCANTLYQTSPKSWLKAMGIGACRAVGIRGV